MTDFTTTELPLRRVALFSSGVGFFERSGQAGGNAQVILPFLAEDVDDALKSLTIIDPASPMPSVTYPAEDTLAATLAGLKPDLGDNPGLADLLNAVRGARIEVTAATEAVTGRVLGVEQRWDSEDGEHPELYLSLYTTDAVQIIPAKTILSYRFLDDDIPAEMGQALDCLLNASTSKLRNLEVRLPSDQTRDVTISYVSSAPVWKASYRLDLAAEPVFLQGWAIIDNASDVDWHEVELSLFVGRPSSFIQPLYRLYHVRRQEIPLAIAGSAAARQYEAAYDDVAAGSIETADKKALSVAAEAAKPASPFDFPSGKELRGGALPIKARAMGRAAGEQFTFTFPQPVTLQRHQSAMLPLTQGELAARKMSILSGQLLKLSKTMNPALGLQVTNNTGTPLPAGPVTVFDDGLYAGDALLDFLPAGAKRLLSYGDDLAVRCSNIAETTNHVSSVHLAKGVLQVESTVQVRTEYVFVNDSAKARRLLLEHPRPDKAELVQPAEADEITPEVYRFELELPPAATTHFAVVAEWLLQNEFRVIDDPRSILVRFSNEQALPPQTQAVLTQAAGIKQRQYQAETELAALETAEGKLVADQARIRENLSVVGPGTRSGAGYQKRLEELEDRLTEVTAKQEQLRQVAEAAAAELADFIAGQDFTEKA